MSNRRFKSRRLVFRSASNYQEVLSFADSLSLLKLYEITGQSSQLVIREVGWQVDPGLDMYYVEEMRTASSFVQVMGDDAEDVRDITEALQIRFSPLTPDELVNAVDTSESIEDSAHAVLQAGLGAPEQFDMRFYERIRAAIESADGQLREAGIWAASFLLWDELRAAIERIESGDPEKRLRSAAKAILNIGYRKAKRDN